MDEAARTRLVAKRCLKERGVVAKHEVTTTVREWKWPWSFKVVEAVLLVNRNGKECDCTVVLRRRFTKAKACARRGDGVQ